MKKSGEPLPLLGGLTADQFLARHWQKRPLLIRGAVPSATTLLRRDDLFAAAGRDDIESRLVARRGEAWSLEHGPFPKRRLRQRKDIWSLLVQGVNLVFPDCDQLMRRFNFIPYARLDDVMASYAVDGGGVGPHFDAYNVFLLQGLGRRRWRIGAQRDLKLVEDAPLKILEDFRPSREWILEPGDMLYLPPNWAHEGTAIGDCMTFSVGFRAPPAQEVATAFLDFLHDTLRIPGRFRDPDLRLQRNPAEIGADHIAQFEHMIRGIRWNRKLVEEFSGRYLTEPKPQVFFDPPAAPLGRAAFERAARRHGVRLDPRTQMLFRGRRIYINGEVSEPLPAATMTSLTVLANHRELRNFSATEPAALDKIYDWYKNGFLDIA